MEHVPSSVAWRRLVRRLLLYIHKDERRNKLRMRISLSDFFDARTDLTGPV